jgi:hypothetical protein
MQSDRSPAESAIAVTTSDTVEIAVTRGLYIGVGGNVVVVMADGRQVTFTGVLAGTVYPLQVKQVRSTSTTATNIVALY